MWHSFNILVHLLRVQSGTAIQLTLSLPTHYARGLSAVCANRLADEAATRLAKPATEIAKWVS